MKPKYWAVVILGTLAITAGLVYYIKQPALDLGPITIHRLKDWKTYRNEEYGFEIKYPSRLIVKSNDTDYLRIVENTNQNEAYLEILIGDLALVGNSETINVNGVLAQQYQISKGICDGPDVCSPPAVATMIKKNNTAYNVIFYNSDGPNLSDENRQILSTFKFAGWVTYTNKKYNFKLKHSENFRVSGDDENGEELPLGLYVKPTGAYYQYSPGDYIIIDPAGVTSMATQFEKISTNYCEIEGVTFAGKEAIKCTKNYDKAIRIKDYDSIGWSKNNLIIYTVNEDNASKKELIGGFEQVLATFKFTK